MANKQRKRVISQTKYLQGLGLFTLAKMHADKSHGFYEALRGDLRTMLGRDDGNSQSIMSCCVQATASTHDPRRSGEVGVKNWTPSWTKDCMRWRGRILTGKYGHWCADWDELPIDETCPEWPCACASELRWERYRPYIVTAIYALGLISTAGWAAWKWWVG